ncbi:MAG: DUF6089 family protein, partial [Bacteroidota bacterium]
IIAPAVDAQGRRKRFSLFKSKKKPYRYELIGSLGATNFLGDLGGADYTGTQGLKDIELALTRPSASISIRYQIVDRFTIKNNLIWGIVKGSDEFTKEAFRNNRNIHFRSSIFELSTQIEFNFMEMQKGHAYKIKSVRGVKHKDRRIYLFVGGGLFYFNPKAQYNGKWHALQPLGTEGQGIIPGKKKYSRVNELIAVGGGMSFAVDRYWSVGFELSMRKTFTDYIDDVSTNYATQTLIASGADPMAVYFADPSQGKGARPESVCEGCQRGDPKDKDAYMFAMLTVGYKILTKRRSRSKF